MSAKLYDYLITNFPLECNSHNARKRHENLGDDVEDIAIFIMNELCRRYNIPKGVTDLDV